MNDHSFFGKNNSIVQKLSREYGKDRKINDPNSELYSTVSGKIMCMFGY